MVPQGFWACQRGPKGVQKGLEVTTVLGVPKTLGTPIILLGVRKGSQKALGNPKGVKTLRDITLLGVQNMLQPFWESHKPVTKYIQV